MHPTFLVMYIYELLLKKRPYLKLNCHCFSNLKLLSLAVSTRNPVEMHIREMEVEAAVDSTNHGRHPHTSLLNKQELKHLLTIRRKQAVAPATIAGVSIPSLAVT